MRAIDPTRSLLLVIDFQARLMPAIAEGEAAIRSAAKLLAIAAMLDIPRLFTEQNPTRLGATVEALPVEGEPVAKFAFDVCREAGFIKRIPADAQVVVTGCEAHVCVLQTVLGLLDAGRKVFVAQDAIGSRKPEDKSAAIRRMERHGAEIVTSEMAAFEWLQTAEHPRFRQAIALIK
ncbi:Nicotinamidase-related amidase [Rhodoblastus acidophilus]|uniref:Nicotinamidase-related amidase n=1 Tax=Rhodoblastus acidophilus TaxID=1074 RepID=A0A212R2V2_RHOAC|nr:isochorismatase family protein [Rhodoblastus acidophilus]PPQ40293.1 isochorismatase [Rhodoblastus acidophilus]RAI17390.1 isochorismatase [Rhodoblastus acidophilus]SNB66317.1 Nicotinamidase-related amidase [Rhodoblastus acidophilus]